RVEPELDEYADAWAAEHTDACEATRSRNEQSEEEMSLRMGCLRQRRQHLRATVNELRQANATVVENAVQAVVSLPGLERCRDLEALRAEVPPPEDPAVAERVAALDELLVAASAKESLGKYEDGLRLADEVVEQGVALQYEPLMARAWRQQGSLREDVGSYEGAVQALRLAYAAALAHGMETEAADVSTQLMFVLGVRLARHQEARAWAEHAEPLSRAVGTDEASTAYLGTLGSVASSRADYEQARRSHQQALAIKEKARGPDHLSLAGSLNNLGNVAYEQGEFGQARELHERSLVIKEKALGSDHPDVAHSLNNLGNVAIAQAEYEDAHELHARALAILEEALGPSHPEVAASHHNLGNVADFQGKHAQAREAYERALAILTTTLGPDHPDVAESLNNLGLVAHAQGRNEEARAIFERALAIFEQARGPEHPLTAYVLGNLGNVAYSQGEYEDARDLSERALVIFEKAQGLDHPNVAYPLTGIGVSLLALAQPADALAPLERALTICTTQDVDPALLAETRFALARALWAVSAAQGRDHPRAHTLAEQARDGYASLGAPNETELAEVQTWLDAHHLP
ncbi:MAG: tetratricopeptide repeat protein, partial [Myxococcales bacterium]|nr:tetratricopeptide repeat protein [Myxococcales bacterium]